MANKVIQIDVKVNSNVDAITQDIQQLTGAIDDTTQSTKELKSSQDQLGNTMKSSGGAILDNGGAMGLLNDATGGLAMTIKDAVEALELFTSGNKANVVVTEAGTVATEANVVATESATFAQKALNLVLKANPYILIASLIAALTAGIYLWVSASKEQEQAMEDVNDSIDANIFATENLKIATANAKTETEQSNNVEIARAKALGKSEAEIQKMIQAQKDLAINTAITNASTARQGQLEAENNLRRLRITIGGGGAFFGGMTDEEEEAVKRAQDALKAATDFYTTQQSQVDIAITDSQINRFNTVAENNKKIEEENKKHGEKLKADNKKAADDEKKRKEDAEKDLIAFQALVNEHQFDDKKLAREQQLELDEKFFKEVEILENKDFETKKANAEAKKKLADLEEKQKEQILDFGINSLNTLTDVLGEETAAGKATAIASTTIATYSSAVKAFDSLAGIPVVGTALGAAAAGIAVASGLANVKKIIAVKTPKGGGGGSVPSGTNSFSSVPLTPQVNLFGNSSNANTVSATPTDTITQQNFVVKAVVSETEITNKQAFVGKVKSSAEI